MLRILASSDLHYNLPRSRPGVRDLAKQVAHRGADVLVLAGDIAGTKLSDFAEALELFEPFKNQKLLVAGNHDLWVDADGDSHSKWAEELPELAKQYDFRMLDCGELIVDDVAFVGNVGWYDYTFRRDDLAIPMRFYEAKIGPGFAAATPELEFLLEPRSELQRRHFRITTAWQDGRYVDLPFGDVEFTDRLIGRLEEQLVRAANKVDKIVSVIHHLPHRELVRYRGEISWDFAAAFLGSPRFSQVLGGYDQVRLCLSGHSHRADCIRDNGVEYVTIGSNYTKKALMEFQL